MSETMKKVITGLVALVGFIISMALIIIGQKHIGPAGLGMMMAGLAGLIILLGIYNHKYK